ncbi:MAG: hypothetical protein V2I41_15305, partial [Pseudomonadales bacterium]|nr:hypothetical protein [Pseudomonadales bacterium]
MSSATTIVLSLLLPLAGAILISMTGRWPNLRETITLVTAVSVALVVASLVPEVMDGGRPALMVAELFDGLQIAFTVEPLGMLFGALAATL